MPLNTGESGATGSTGGSIGGYTLVERLGSGGMGVVYLARSASGRQVAVKVVHAQHALDEEFRARFRQEIAAVRRVSGAFTAPVVDADPDADQPWMATLYVPGPTLAEAVDRQGPLGGRELRALALGLVEALRDIHQAGVVHRDLKPSNVLIAEDGPRVIDFGISRAADNQALTVTGRLIGTPPFMSPEQFASPKDVTPASDVFSLGSLLVYAATGTRPFDGASPYMTGYQVMHEAPTLDGVPEPLRAIATRCLDKDPTARPTPTELHALLQTLPDVSPPVAPEAATPPEPTTTTTTSPPPARRRRTLIALATALAVTALAVTASHMLSSHTAASGTPTASTSSTSGSRTAVLPARWRPWQSSLTRTFNGAPPLYASQSGCVAGTGTAMYCTGRGFTVTKLDAATGRVLWRYGTNPQQVLPAGVRDGLVYVYQMPAGALYADKQPVQLVALDANTGKQRWSRPNGQYLDQAYLFSRGILTTSTNQTQYVAYGTSGEQLWRTSASAPAGRSCSPLVLGTAPYVLCTPDDNASTVSVTLFSLAASDGTRRALATLPPMSESLGTVGGQLLFAVPVAQDKAEALDITYQALLRVNPNTGAMERIPLTGNPTGTPALVDGVVYFVRQDGTVTAVTAPHGKRLWQHATEIEDLSAPTVSTSYGTVYLANRFGRLLALNSTTGAERWHTSALKVERDSTEDAHVLLLKDAIVVTATGTAFSVSPDHPTATQSPSTTSN